VRRALFIFGFGLLGIIFVFFVQAMVVEFLDHDLHQYESGSDERGERELKALFLGGPLFFAIWGWIGNASSRNGRRGIVMVGGVVLATLICFGVPGLHGPFARIFDYSGNSAGLVAWSLVAASFALLLDRMIGRTGK
jgi:energy-coupling factor transporter transmembrane protein EcfT